MFDKNEISKIFETLMVYEKSGFYNNFTINGVNYWAIIRSELQYNLLKTEEQINFMPSKLPQLSFFSSLKYKYKANQLLKKIKTNIESLYLNQTDVVLFSAENAYYTDKVEGKLYNRHLDPLFELLNKKKVSCQKIHLLKQNEEKNKFYPAVAINLDKNFKEYLWFLSTLLQKKTSKIDSRNLFDKLKINQNNLNSRLYLVFALKNIFKVILNKVAPKTIGVVCFYDDYSFALTLAAKELNIKTFDIQHGKQGDQHFCYSHLVNVKSKSKNLLPSFFLNWGQDSIDNIKKHLLNKSDINCVIGGNLWLSKWKNTNFYNETQEEKLFILKIKKYKKTFLYGAQPLSDDIIPEFFIEVMQTNLDMFFCIRLHPRDKHLIEHYKIQFQNNKNIEIEISTNAPLYFLLKNIDCVVTRWSSVALEALYFDCKSIIIDKFGAESFEQYINNGLIKLVLNKNEFSVLLDDNKKINHKSNNTMLFDENVINKSIDFLLRN